MTVDIASNISTFPSKRLKAGVRLEEASGLNVTGEASPIRIWFAADGILMVSTTMYKEGGKAAVIEANKFAKFDETWDGNSDQRAFEVVNERGIVVFQITRPHWDYLRIRGLLTSQSGTGYYLSDEGLIGSLPRATMQELFAGKTVQIKFAMRMVELPPIPPLFRYPSKRYPHKRAEGARQP